MAPSASTATATIGIFTPRRGMTSILGRPGSCSGVPRAARCVCHSEVRPACPWGVGNTAFAGGEGNPSPPALLAAVARRPPAITTITEHEISSTINKARPSLLAPFSITEREPYAGERAAKPLRPPGSGFCKVPFFTSSSCGPDAVGSVKRFLPAWAARKGSRAADRDRRGESG
jgi:hypothetical protein